MANEWAEAAYPGDPLAHLLWWCLASEQAAAELSGVLAERDRLRAELEEQKRLVLALGEKLAICAESLTLRAEGGTVQGHTGGGQ